MWWYSMPPAVAERTTVPSEEGMNFRHVGQMAALKRVGWYRHWMLSACSLWGFTQCTHQGIWL